MSTPNLAGAEVLQPVTLDLQPLACAGSVRFVRDVPVNSPSGGVTSTSPHPGISWGGAQSRAGLEMMPPLEAIHGAEAARGIAPVDVRTPGFSHVQCVPWGASEISTRPPAAWLC